MASDIVPIQLSLTAGDLVTLWAPRWREDGEDWEAFLGDDDALFAFPEVAQLAAFVRTATEHDLTDHPAWSVVPDLTVAELTPQDTRRYDIVGVPELVAEDADTWTISELAEITDMVRSIADVCELDGVARGARRRPRLRAAAPGHAAVRRPRGGPAVVPAGGDGRRALGPGHRRAGRAGRDPGRRPGRAGRGGEGGRRRRRGAAAGDRAGPGGRRGRGGRGRRRGRRVLGGRRHRPDPDHHPGRLRGHAALLPRRRPGVPRLRRPDRGVPRASGRWPAGSPTTAPTGTTWPPRPPGRRSSSRPAWAS